MREVIRCILYLAFIGAACFVLGRVLPKSAFDPDRPPFRLYGWEREGAAYNAIGVRKWKEKLPDMSAILPKAMPSKRLPKEPTPESLELMIRETCVAEWIHGLLCLLGFGCVLLWKGLWGWAVSVLYFVGNVPFIIIQRYNRPKLTRILRRLREKESVHEKCDRFELRHGTGA